MKEVRDYACRLLARREYSVAELERRLRVKWPGSEEVDTVVSQLVEEGLLSDRRFTRVFVRSRIARHQGPRRIRAELMRRSVSDEDIGAVLDDVGRSWTELAREWLARQGAKLSDFDSRAKYYRRLVNRGFTHDQAMDALGGPGSESEGL